MNCHNYKVIITLLMVMLISVYANPLSNFNPIIGHEFKYIDLSHTLNNNTLHWLTLRDPLITFNKAGHQNRLVQYNQRSNSTYYLQSDRLEIDLHTGTHIDAPVHFGEGKWSVDKIPLEHLINVPVAVIDVHEKCEKLRTYEITVDDIQAYETNWNMQIPNNSLVLFYTGISKSWSRGRNEYFSTNTTDITKGAIPGVSEDAAKFLTTNRTIVGVGIDSPSIDNSQHSAFDPIAHEIFSANNIYIIENINTQLEKLITYKPGAVLATTLPIAIERVSGTPIRLVATITKIDSTSFDSTQRIINNNNHNGQQQVMTMAMATHLMESHNNASTSGSSQQLMISTFLFVIILTGLVQSIFLYSYTPCLSQKRSIC